MDYEPQTMSMEDMNARLELFKKELLSVTESADSIEKSTEEILTAVDRKITAAMGNQ